MGIMRFPPILPMFLYFPAKIAYSMTVYNVQTEMLDDAYEEPYEEALRIYNETICNGTLAHKQALNKAWEYRKLGFRPNAINLKNKKVSLRAKRFWSACSLLPL